jgi:signal transduction histidine kinase
MLVAGHVAGETPEVPLELRAALELATADELDRGMSRVLALLRSACGAERIEWWAPAEGRELRLVVADGEGRGRRQRLPLGPAGAIVVVGGRSDPRFASMVAGLIPVLRRRYAAERLADAVMRLARRNEALEDFAALVAHEVKTPLEEALRADDPSRPVERALELVDSLLEAGRASRQEALSCPAACLDEAIRDLGEVEIVVTSELTPSLPFPAASLRVILRNLLRNAVAAGARHVHVAAAQSSEAWRLLVDDDGIGLCGRGGYATGNGLGLSLCRRIARRYDGSLELASSPEGGTRATLLLGPAS